MQKLPFCLSIFSGAFLLFLVQPLIAKFILPWFGGSPAVWTTCMLFFQLVLLAGYAYAHFSTRYLKPRQQVIVHLVLLTVALLTLPIIPSEFWQPSDSSSPVRRILALLGACIGLPYFVVSTTGPLMQAWFNHANPGASPYRLYSLSNAGSLLALLSYPFLVEPNFSRHNQAVGWSIGLGVFSVIVAWCGLAVWRKFDDRKSEKVMEDPSLEDISQNVVNLLQRILWFTLPACGTVLLLAVTNKICQDIAVIPFMWILPLSLYLLSFIICFDSPRWYSRSVWVPLMIISLATVLWMHLGAHMPTPQYWFLKPVYWLASKSGSLSYFKSIAIYVGSMFIICIVCHGELFRLRPVASKLTDYYLTISAGGAFGGLCVAVLAPMVFKAYFELQAGLFISTVLVAAVLYIDSKSPFYRGRYVGVWILIALLIGVSGLGFYYDVKQSTKGAIFVDRNFYGTLRIEETLGSDSKPKMLTLMHGEITHGIQYLSEDSQNKPCSYYTPSSGIGRLMQFFPKKNNRRVGVIGLGTGTMASWSKLGDYYRFYEINEAVRQIANHRFTYLKDAPAKIHVVMGDARLSLQKEPDQQFDILVLDAFSSDAIPTHLLTREAFEIYRRHIHPNGVIAVHISNTYLNLEPVVQRIAKHFKYHAALITYNGDESLDDEDLTKETYTSDWVLLTHNQSFLDQPEISSVASPLNGDGAKIDMWTDDKSDLFHIMVLDDDGWLAWCRRWIQ